jgi:adenosylcobinamide kinase/adenosylcobinamide-phosphate guanylyltransferase
MRDRIARHRAERPPEWLTVEEPLDLARTCRRLVPQLDLIVVDCLTVWVANLLDRGRDDAAVLSDADELAAILGERGVSLIVVSNEVGEGVHPPTEIGLRFRDLLGAVNQRIAAAADLVTLMVAGIPVPIKRAAAGPPRGERGDRSHEGP